MYNYLIMKKKKEQQPESNISLGGNIIAIDGLGTLTSIGSTTSTFVNPITRVLINTEVKNNSDGTFIELTYEEVPYYQYSYTIHKVISKDIYGVKDGKLCVLKTVRGREIPGYYVNSKIEWEE